MSYIAVLFHISFKVALRCLNYILREIINRGQLFFLDNYNGLGFSQTVCFQILAFASGIFISLN